MLNKRLEREGLKSSVSSNETASSVVRWKGRKGVVPSTAPRGLYIATLRLRRDGLITPQYRR